MFSEHWYNPVSIYDICGTVGIKESTVYYHFKNKQDILDSLFIQFEEHINFLLDLLHSPDAWNNSQRSPFEWINLFLRSLFDGPFLQQNDAIDANWAIT